MDNIIFNIKNQIYETFTLCGDFLKNVNLPILLIIMVLLFVIFFRNWQIKKIFSFFLTIFILFILLVRFEAFFLSTFGKEDTQMVIAIDRIVFLIVSSIVLIYHATIAE